MPALLVKIGDGPVERFSICRECLVIGRAETVDIHVDDASVSRVHCQVSRTPGGRWLLQDFGSRNRTYLGDRPIAKHELIHGDVFYVGPAKIVFSGAPAEGDGLPGGSTLPVEERDELLMAEADSRFSGLADEFRDQVDVSDELAEMAAATRVEADKCPLCGAAVLPGRTYCAPCGRRLDEQAQAMQLRPEEKPSLWRRLFGR